MSNTTTKPGWGEGRGWELLAIRGAYACVYNWKTGCAEVVSSLRWTCGDFNMEITR